MYALASESKSSPKSVTGQLGDLGAMYFNSTSLGILVLWNENNTYTVGLLLGVF